MDVNFEYYKTFYYVAKYKNITKAAMAMNSNQPNVTRIMKLLENELHCRLLIREPRGIRLTEEGEKLLSRVEIAVEQLYDAEEEIGKANLNGAGTVTIGVTETALHLFLLDKLPDFKEIYPGARIKIRNHTTPETLKNLSAGRLDFALITTPFQGSKDFSDKEIISFREILVGGTEYEALGKKKWELKELTGYPWIGLGEETVTYEFYKDFFLEEGTVLMQDIEVVTSDLLIPFIRNNLGIGFVPERMAEPEIRENKLIQIPLAHELPERQIRLVYDKRRSRSVVAEQMKRFLMKAGEVRRTESGLEK